MKFIKFISETISKYFSEFIIDFFGYLMSGLSIVFLVFFWACENFVLFQSLVESNSVFVNSHKLLCSFISIIPLLIYLLFCFVFGCIKRQFAQRKVNNCDGSQQDPAVMDADQSDGLH